jgi:dTMP kinase
VGIDGSGKTTQARRLATRLTGLGIPASYSRNAGGRRWFGRLAGRLGRADAEHLLGRPGLLLVESVLRWLAIARGLLLARLTGQVAIMDRYAYCQYASIRVYGGGRWERLARLAYRVFPVPDVTFLLAVRPEEAYRRIEARGTDHETRGYLAAADAAYRSLPEWAGFVVVDANNPPDEVARLIGDRFDTLVVAGDQPFRRTRAPWRQPGRKVGSFALWGRTFAGITRRG